MLEHWQSWSTRRWVRLIFHAVVLLLMFYLLYQARGALLPFVLGLVLAYLVLPAVGWLERLMPRFLRRRKADRVLAIVIVYAIATTLIVGFILFLVPVLVSQVEQLIANWPAIVDAVETTFADLVAWYEEAVPPQVQALVETQLAAAEGQIVQAVQQGIVGFLTAIADAVSVILGLVIVPVWLFLFLFDAGEYRKGIISLIPETARPDALNVGRIANDVLGSYIRGQLLVALIVGTLSTIALLLLGVPFAILLGVLVFFGDLIPTLGPILAAIPTVLIAALQRPLLGLWALLALVAVQQFESALIGPRIVGESVRLRPALIIFLLVLAGSLWGLIGLLVAVPLFAFGRDIVRYAGLRTMAEPLTPNGALQRVRVQRRRQLT